MNLLWLFTDFLSISIKGLLRNWSGFWLIFYEFYLKNSWFSYEFGLNLGQDLVQFHSKCCDFIIKFHWFEGFEMREIFHWIFGVLLSLFHWFDPVTATLFLYHFLIDFDWISSQNWVKFNFISIWIRFGFKMDLIWFYLNFHHFGIILA